MAKTTKKAKKPARKTTIKKAKSYDDMKSFRIYKEPSPFMSFKITRQTVYWLVLLVILVFLILWILRLQIDLSQVMYSLQTMGH